MAVCVDGFALFVGAGIFSQCHSLVANGAEEFSLSSARKMLLKKTTGRPFNEVAPI